MTWISLISWLTLWLMDVGYNEKPLISWGSPDLRDPLLLFSWSFFGFDELSFVHFLTLAGLTHYSVSVNLWSGLTHIGFRSRLLHNGGRRVPQVVLWLLHPVFGIMQLLMLATEISCRPLSPSPLIAVLVIFSHHAMSTRQSSCISFYVLWGIHVYTTNKPTSLRVCIFFSINRAFFFFFFSPA